MMRITGLVVACMVAAARAASPCDAVAAGQSAVVCDEQRYGLWTCSADGTHKHVGCPGQQVCTAINGTAADCHDMGPALTCVANRSATPDVLGGAIGWVCGQEDCAAVNQGGSRYFPNTLVSHADWAFNAYFVKSGKSFEACKFGGAAEMVFCNPDCYKCRVRPGADAGAVGTALSWVCGPGGLGNCDAINEGGAHYEPNTLNDHASWAFNAYYEALKCVEGGAPPCDFGGVAETVPCDA